MLPFLRKNSVCGHYLFVVLLFAWHIGARIAYEKRKIGPTMGILSALSLYGKLLFLIDVCQRLALVLARERIEESNNLINLVIGEIHA